VVSIEYLGLRRRSGAPTVPASCEAVLATALPIDFQKARLAGPLQSWRSSASRIDLFLEKASERVALSASALGRRRNPQARVALSAAENTMGAGVISVCFWPRLGHLEIACDERGRWHARV
jgi:hypothetical protein